MSDKTQKEIAEITQDIVGFIKTAAPQLERLGVLEKEVAVIPGLRKEASDKQAVIDSFVKKAGAWADSLVEKGMLSEGKKVAFVTLLAKDPSSVFDSFDKVASMQQVDSMGSGGEGQPVAQRDPFVDFCMGR